MFNTRPFYGVTCDTCGKPHEGYEHDWWIDETMAKEDAICDDWQACAGRTAHAATTAPSIGP